MFCFGFVSLRVASADLPTQPSCDNMPPYECYPSGMNWGGHGDRPSHYQCEAQEDKWGSARREVYNVIDELCHGEWANKRVEPAESIGKCQVLHHHVLQWDPSHEVRLRWLEMHVIFRIRNGFNETRELEPEECGEFSFLQLEVASSSFTDMIVHTLEHPPLLPPWCPHPMSYHLLLYQIYLYL